VTTRDEDDLPPDREPRWWHRVLACVIMLLVTVVVLVAILYVSRGIDVFLTAQLGKFESNATALTIVTTWLLCQVSVRRGESNDEK
jgi:hypothetical protein